MLSKFDKKWLIIKNISFSHATPILKDKTQFQAENIPALRKGNSNYKLRGNSKGELTKVS